MNENTKPAGGGLAYFEKLSLAALVLSHLSTDTDRLGGDPEASFPERARTTGPRKVVVETTCGNIDIIIHNTAGDVSVEVS